MTGPVIRGRTGRSPYPPPETIQHLKGKPETGINASVIYPQQTIRSPYAAPFEFCLSASARAVQLGVAAQVDPHTQKKARLMPGPMRAMRTA